MSSTIWPWNIYIYIYTPQIYANTWAFFNHSRFIRGQWMLTNLLLMKMMLVTVAVFLVKNPSEDFTYQFQFLKSGCSFEIAWVNTEQNIAKLVPVGALLLEEIVNSCDGEGILAIINAAKQWFTESQSKKAAGNASWWRVIKNLFVILFFLWSKVYLACLIWDVI